jgi:hypothetical protein
MTEVFTSPGFAPGFRWGQHGLSTFGASADFVDTGGVFPDATLALTANKLYGAPIYSGRGGVADRLYIKVTAAASAGKKARLGIYLPTSVSNLYPADLVADAGEVATDGVATVFAAVSVPLPPGALLWYVVICNEACTVTAGDSYFTFGALAAGLSSGYGGVEVAQVYGALPAVFPPGGLLRGTTPIVGIRRSA